MSLKINLNDSAFLQMQMEVESLLEKRAKLSCTQPRSDIREERIMKRVNRLQIEQEKLLNINW